jgi:tripartite-type tricarboxylate transporter receptor subunit TctC
MRLSKKNLTAACLLCLPMVVLANNFPDRAVRIVAAYPPAGGVDITARIIAPHLEKRLGQPVIIENRAGAAGTIGAAAVTRATADGYTMLVTANPSITILPQFSETGYKAEDLLPVAKVGIAPSILATSADSSIKNLADFLEEGRKKGGNATVGVPGAGSTPHIEMTLLGQVEDSDITVVPYRGATFIVTDILGNQISGGSMALPAIVPQVQSGKMLGLAVFSPNRSSILPDVPTVKESIKNDMSVFPTWYGYFVPAGTPPEIVKVLEEAILSAMDEPTVIEQLKKTGTEALKVGSAQFLKENNEESESLKLAVERTNIKIK